MRILQNGRATRTRVIAFVSLAFIASAQGAEGPAEDGLTKFGLKRVGSVYVLVAESDVQRKLSQAKLMSKYMDVLERQTASVDPMVRRGMIQDLNDRLNDLFVEVNAAKRELAKMPRNRWGYPITNGIAAQIEALQAYRENLEREIDQKKHLRDSMVNRPPDPKQVNEIKEELKSRRDKYREAVRELKGLVDSISAQYGELAKNDEVAKAITKLGRSIRPKPTLGPSKVFVANRKIVERLGAQIVKWYE